MKGTYVRDQFKVEMWQGAFLKWLPYNGKKGFNISYSACLENAYFVRDYHLA